MYRFLRKPSWVALGIVSLLLGVVFVTLGLWQLRRLTDVKAENAQIEARLSGQVVPLETAVERRADLITAGEAGRFQPVSVTGVFDQSEEVLIRSQTNNGIAGFHVITPLVLDDGTAILINRGWVPLEMDTPPVPAGSTSGTQTLTVVLQASQERSRFGPADPEGDAPRLNRVDIDRIAAQVPYELFPVYGLAASNGETLPVPVELPELVDGPHLAYAIQWFAFAVIAVGGFLILVRREARRTKRTPAAAASGGS